MKNGLYEIPLLDVKETDKVIKKENIEVSEMPKVLSKEYEVLLRKKLEGLNKDQVFTFYRDLYRLLDKEAVNPELLLGVHESEDLIKELTDNRPLTSIAFSSLFTGKKGEPTLVSELKREIRTSERIDLLISFVKYSGIRLILDDLEAFTKNNKLRIITTSYMGASDYKAIERLSKLPNTQVKVTFDTERTRLHAKAYYFERSTGFSTAYVGSSNLSKAAISSGLEWNVKISEYTSPDVMNKFQGIFDSYWNDDEFVTFDPNNDVLKDQLIEALKPKETSFHLGYFDLKPYPYQQEILDELTVERQVYNSYKNLIVAATGTGKTIISAFDYKRFAKSGDDKLLFIAHRKEILEQSMATFRMILKDQNFGELWIGGDRPNYNSHVFCTVQTLSRASKFLRYNKDHFDYIVLDETHHASASSYLGIIDYFKPKVLLGLTATPERMDGNDITLHFNNRIASEIRLSEAINRKLLSPFHYFGISDSVDLEHMAFKRGKYLPAELENIYTKNDQRVGEILKSLDRYVTDVHEMKALGFCITKKHAAYMADRFNKAGIPSVNLDSDYSKELRSQVKTKLLKGHIKCIFVVDLYNEGVDIPEVDTVMFLRPTESMTVFLQQLGRGLRLTDDKEALTVLDFVGRQNKEYDFSMKFRSLIGKSKHTLKREIENEFPNMPTGCSIQLEKVAVEHILRNIQSSTINKTSLRRMLQMFDQHYDLELNLENFINMYHLDLKQFYSSYTFYDLCHYAGIIKDYQAEDKFKKVFLRRLSAVNSSEFLMYVGSCFKNKELIKNNMAGMLHYTLCSDKPELTYEDSFNKFIKKNSSLVKEALELIDYLLKHQKLIKKRVDIGYDLPLDLYGDYHLDQILAALDVNTENQKYPLRQGVFYVKDKDTDIFFVTINKMEGDYLESTMYNDYAISDELFHWESQSTTSTNSPTGKRYISNDPNHKVLLFVREAKQQYKKTMPYTFLGRARYVSHSGSKPIKMVWKLDEKIPQRIIRESKLKLVE
ncbi:DUF3427 domain-containing protein [Acidaminobacter sp. JC074]|uniref:DUF3427 domain-containing protein n=1 Tax=Acidaminobacter sp. JC074 TaxID=2530199 RepID=UPI001F0E5203|nr:DEAD/DEAH box helicase [Acidaminobacter sp. JC074]MCH4887933.1 DUF3427 domain-containing protein [Acidaminobacter sp. JC074]